MRGFFAPKAEVVLTVNFGFLVDLTAKISIGLPASDQKKPALLYLNEVECGVSYTQQ
jgi:hypothetical protein